MIVPILNSREVRHTAAERPRVAGTSTSKLHITFSIQDNELKRSRKILYIFFLNAK